MQLRGGASPNPAAFDTGPITAPFSGYKNCCKVSGSEGETCATERSPTRALRRVTQILSSCDLYMRKSYGCLQGQAHGGSTHQGWRVVHWHCEGEDCSPAKGSSVFAFACAHGVWPKTTFVICAAASVIECLLRARSDPCAAVLANARVCMCAWCAAGATLAIQRVCRTCVWCGLLGLRAQCALLVDNWHNTCNCGRMQRSSDRGGLQQWSKSAIG